MATLGELDDAVKTAREAGCQQLVPLNCTSNYPSCSENTNLRTISHLLKLFKTEVGLRDHTMGISAAVAAIALGASVVEKHFTLARADCGVYSAFSLEPAELSSLVSETERAWQALGHVRYGPTEAEQKSLVFRRSIYAAADIAAGEIFNDSNIRIVRPGNVAPPYLYQKLLGRHTTRAYQLGTPLRIDQLL